MVRTAPSGAQSKTYSYFLLVIIVFERRARLLVAREGSKVGSSIIYFVPNISITVCAIQLHIHTVSIVV